MKHIAFQSIIALFLVSSSVYGYEVSTEVQKKKVLLEEFTAIHCGYCPQGHAIGNRLITAQPENIYVIAIHSGSLAVPGSDEPDYRTTTGDLLATEFGVQSYPSGTVNRHAFNNSSTIIMGRGDWAQKVKDICKEDASVNLWMNSQFDGTDRKLTITVEGYYTGEPEQTDNFLNIAWTQSNIQGPQSGGGVGNEYIHKHMLRGYITQEWGDTIPNAQQGTYFTRTYTYQLPENVNNIKVEPEDIEVISFLCKDKTEVLNVIGSKPKYINYEKPIGATLNSPNINIDSSYGFNFFEMVLANNSNQTIEEVDFKITVNEKEQQIKWNENLSGFKEAPIRIDVAPYDIEENNQYKIEITAINGEAFQSNNTILSGRFKAPVKITPQMNLTIKTDLYAEENTFTIKDQDGTILKTFGPYPSMNSKEYQEQIELEDNKIYCFEVTDMWGDGIQQPRGNYKIYNNDNSLAVKNENIESFGYRTFFQISQTASISSQSAKEVSVQVNQKEKNIAVRFASDASRIIEVYSVTGKLCNRQFVNADQANLSVADIPVGLYLLRIMENGQESIHKFVLEQ